jgi:hypothetical protein
VTSRSDAQLDLEADFAPRSAAEIRQHCAELRAILRATRASGPLPQPLTRQQPELVRPTEM